MTEEQGFVIVTSGAVGVYGRTKDGVVCVRAITMTTKIIKTKQNGNENKYFVYENMAKNNKQLRKTVDKN